MYDFIATQRKLVGRIYPNGEFSVGQLPEGASLVPPEAAENGWELDVDREFLIQSVRVHGALETAQELGINLGSSDAINSHSGGQERRPRGSNGLSSYGGRMLRNGAFLIAEGRNPSQVSFGTCTLPSLDDMQLSMVLSGWSDVVKVFFQRLKRTIARRGGIEEMAWCVEIQEKRSLKEGRILPHIHFLFLGRDSTRSPWIVATSEIQQFWKDALCCVCPSMQSLDFDSSTNIARVRCSVEGYLAKYISKGNKTELYTDKMLHQLSFIHSYWGMTARLKQRIKRRTLYDTKTLGKALLFYTANCPEDVRFCRDVFLDEDYGGSWVGAFGKVSTSAISKINLLRECWSEELDMVC
jgi:hypothetical protein